jgi:RNA polymerase sigma-70 factor, ECF subfamily
MAEKSAIFAELLLESRRDLFGLIYSLVQNLPDAEDVYQDTALVLWQKFDDFTLGTNFSAWAMRVAHLRVLKHAAAKRKQRLFFSDALLESISQAYQRDAAGADRGNRRSEALENCLQKLSARDRRLVTRCYAPDRDYADIAQSEGRTVGAIYQAVDRIRKALFACVERTLAMEGRR